MSKRSSEFVVFEITDSNDPLNGLKLVNGGFDNTEAAMAYLKRGGQARDKKTYVIASIKKYLECAVVKEERVSLAPLEYNPITE